MRRWEALNITKFDQNFQKYSVFFRPHTPTYTDGGEIWRKVVDFSFGQLIHTKFNPIGAVCRPCGEKTLKIALVTELNTAGR